MYATLPFRHLLNALIWPFALIVVALVFLRGLPASPSEWLKVISAALSGWAVVLILVGGSAKKWSPWRVLWRIFPALNEVVFPDLNGKWEGTTSSNWSVISLMKDHACETGGIDLETLSNVPLQEDAITITIKASLFSLRLSAELHRTGSVSHSIAARVVRDDVRDEYDLSYVYRQNTPEAGLLDEASHLGAAVLRIETTRWQLRGEYWTKRSWRMGLNTAGLIEVARQRS